MKKRIVNNLGTGYLQKIVTLGAIFLIVPFLTRRLGKESYGLIVLAESAVLCVVICMNSLRIAMSRAMTHAYSAGRQEDFLEYAAASRFLSLAGAAAVVAGGVALGLLYPHAVNMSAERVGETAILFILLALGTAMSFASLFFASMLDTRQRPDQVSIAICAGAILKVALIFLVYLATPTTSVVPYAAVFVFTLFWQNALAWRMYRRIWPDVRVRRIGFELSRAKEMLGRATHLLAGYAGDFLYEIASLVIVGPIWGPAAVAVYSISQKPAVLLKRLFIETTTSLTPLFTDLAAKGDRDAIEKLYRRYARVMCFVGVPACVGLIVIGRPLIEFWAGPGFEAAGDLLPIHMLPMFAAIPFGLSGCVIVAFDKVAVPGRMSVAMGLLSVGLGLLSGVVFGGGLAGVAWSAALCSFLYLGVFLPVYACRISGITLFARAAR